MTQKSLPWNGDVIGDSGPYSDAEWAEVWRYIIGLASHRPNVGVLLGTGDSGVEGLKVRATTPASANIEVAAGAALMNGTAFFNDATVALTIAANGSGNPRIDTVILRKDFSAQTVRLAVLQGTAAVTPSPPALTQTPNVMWEIPLANIAVANGFVSIANADIQPCAEPANAADGVYLDMVLNNSGGELNTGDAVIWDTTTNRAVTTTTTAANPLVAGVWVGRTANGGYGRLQVGGIGLVRVNGAVATRTSLFVTSGTAKQAAVQSAGIGGVSAVFAQALETTAGAGLCLAHINVPVRSVSPTLFTQTANRAFNTTNAEETLFSTGVGTLTLSANALTVGKSVRIIISGFFGTAAAPGNLTLRIRLGGTQLAISDVLNQTASLAARGFRIEVTITCRSVGVTGTVSAQGFYAYQISTLAMQGLGIVGSGTPVTIDTTIAQAIDVTWQFGTSNAANTVTVTNALVEVL